MANVCQKLSKSKFNSMKKFYEKFYEKTIQIKFKKNKSFKMRIMQ